ncbi:MAG: lactonase family protein [Verrucomicrobiae bacterium]|nr:lactonase family protein [Verrucomicrobiae bacterium]
MKISPIISAIFVSVCVSVGGTGDAEAQQTPRKPRMLVYIGTYTGGGSEGIYVFRMNPKNGKLRNRQLAAKSEQPSFLALSPDKKFLYAANETSEWKGERGTGGVTSFAIDSETGKLTELNSQPSGGGAPCHLIVDPSGKNVLTANYSGGNVSVFPVAADGSLGSATGFMQHTGKGANPNRQGEPHAHSINLDPSAKFAFVADLGIDRLMSYRFDARAGTLSPNETPSAKVADGSGPRHFAFHPDGKTAYVINEMAMSVKAFRYDSVRGVLTEYQTISTLGGEAISDGQSTAHVEVHPSGKFLYGSNRGHDTIVVYAIHPQTGELTYVENQSILGKTPRNFGISPDGQFLIAANQNSNDLVVFSIDQETGALEPTGTRVECPNPVCVKFLPLR